MDKRSVVIALKSKSSMKCKMPMPSSSKAALMRLCPFGVMVPKIEVDAFLYGTKGKRVGWKGFS